MNPYHLVFSGQGSQFVGMGNDFYNQFPEAKSLFESANDILGYSISDICFEGPSETLNLTQHTQVAIFIVSAAIFQALPQNDIAIASVAGHSLGEITAYYAAGVLDFESALNIVIKRGQLMGQAAEQTSGKMAAIIGLDQATIESIIDPITGCAIANYNSPQQLVISGESSAIELALPALQKAGAKRIIELPVSGAFHSPLMRSAVLPFRSYLESFQFNAPRYPIVLNRTALAETNPDQLKENLSLQIESSVQWIASIESMGQDLPSFIEVGPGKVLSGLIKKINRSFGVYPTSTLEGIEQIKVEVLS